MTSRSSEYGIFKSGFLSDQSTRFLILSNIILIIFALFENWNLITLMFIYWCQSIIIGFFTFLKMLTLKDFSTEGVNYDQMPPSSGAKVFMSIFFLFHYGMFHFAYYTFLINGAFFRSNLELEAVGLSLIIVIGVFFANHLFSFLYNRKRDANKKQNIGKIMMFPYIRIIPMHLTIIFGGMFIISGGSAQGVILLFLVLKTIADVAMHSIEHRDTVASKMKINMDQTNYSPGENIRGSIVLNFNKPVKAKSLIISFIVEKNIISAYGKNRSAKRYEIYKNEKTFDDGEYSNKTYFFDFQIPSDILSSINNFELDPHYLRIKEYAEKYPRWSANIFREYNSFYIQATLDVPLGFNISNKKTIVIS